MSKHLLKIAIVLVLSFSLAACSGISTASLTGTSSQTATNPLAAGPSKLDLSAKLGVGILELESANLPITAEQADALLPLWQAVKSIGADRNGSTIEMDALYQQIQESLTTEQVQAIQNMTWTQAELIALYQQKGSQTEQADQSSSTTSAASSTTSSQAAQGPADGGPGNGGIMIAGGGPGGAMGDMTGMSAMSSSSSDSQVTQTDLLIQAAAASSGINDLNTTFASAVINLLQNTISA